MWGNIYAVLGLLLLFTPVATSAEPPGIMGRSFRFTDASEAAGLAQHLRGAFTHALAWGDFDNDGKLELFVGTFADRSPRYGMKEAPPNMLFRQVAPGKFERFPCPAVEVPGRCSGAVFADLYDDGDLDLYVSSNTLVKPTPREPKRTAQAQGSKLYRNDGGGKFVDISKESGACPSTLVRCRDIGVLDHDGDGLLDLLIMQDKGIRPEDRIPGVRLFRNLGNLKFEDVTRKVGLPDDIWTAGLAVADLNGDRRPDFYLCGSNRLYLSQPDHTYREARQLRAVFNQPEKELDWVTSAVFGDLDLDGDLDLVTGRHHYYGPSRVHVYLNEGVKDGIPQFRESTRELGIPALPQKAPHPEIQDFDNDGIPDLYWSAYFARGKERWPFICKGKGVKEGLPRFDVPAVDKVKIIYNKEGTVQNDLPEGQLGMVYYVDSPAADYDGDGDLDFIAGIWPDEPSRLFRNDTPGGNWIQVRIESKGMNHGCVGAKVYVHPAGKAGTNTPLLGYSEITVNGGYSSGRAAMAHFGLGKATACDVTVIYPLPIDSKPHIVRNVTVNQLCIIRR